MVGNESGTTSAKRTLPPETISQLRTPAIATWFDLADPAEHASVSLDRVTSVSKACPSTGWTVSVFAGARRIFSYLPLGIQEDILARWDDVPLFAAGLMPSGTIKVEDGKTLLSGRWPYVSGADYADYILLAALIQSDKEPEVRFFPVAREALVIEDTWTTVGLGATRTNAVVVTALEVDLGASCPRNAWLRGVSNGNQGTSGAALSGLTFLAPALGAAYSAFDTMVCSTRRTPLTEYEVTRLSGMLHSVQLLLNDSASLAAGGAPGSDIGAKIDRNSAYAAEVLHDASSKLKALGGTSGLMRGPFGRAIADLDTAVTHVALKYETAACRSFPDTVFGSA